MAGDVAAAIAVDPATGLMTLFVTGDDAANAVEIIGPSQTGQYELAGLADAAGTPTTINGQPSAALDGGTGLAMVVRAGGGDDRVLFGRAGASASTSRGLSIDTGNGADAVEVRNAFHTGDLVIQTGRGDDVITVRQNTTMDPVFASVAGSGTGNVLVDVGQGQDQLFIGGLFGAIRSVVPGSGSFSRASARTVTILTDRGDDRVEVTGFAAGNAVLSGGQGEDALSLLGRGIFTPFGTSEIFDFESVA
jgi:hypothetical protein